MREILEKARANLDLLRKNQYPGRGIIVGMDETAKFLVQIYWIMGRSSNSRNRVFKYDDSGRVWTEAANPKNVEDPSLIFYNAMLEEPPSLLYVVSNGVQTDKIMDLGFGEAMSRFEYESDAPNYTPRISAVSYSTNILMSTIWKPSAGCACTTYQLKASQGIGYCLTTYQGLGEPLPSFTDEPYPLPLRGNIDDISQEYWKTLNEENKISLAVKFIPIYIGRKSTVKIINKYVQVNAGA